MGDKQRDKDLAGIGGVFNPLNLNLYAYVGLNPMKYVDPDGAEKQYSVQLSGTAAFVMLGIGGNINVGVSVPDNPSDWRGYQAFTGGQANVMAGGGGYLGYGVSGGVATTDGPLPTFSTDSGWYAEADVGVGPVAVGVSVQGPGELGRGKENNPPNAGSVTILPKAGQGVGVWVSPLGKYGSATVATPTLGSIVDSVKAKFSSSSASSPSSPSSSSPPQLADIVAP